MSQGTERFSSGAVQDALFCVEISRTHNRHLEFEVMVMGWVNSSSHFCRSIQKSTADLSRFGVSTYIDESIIIKEVLQRTLPCNRPSMIDSGPTNSCSSPRRRSLIWRKLISWGTNCPLMVLLLILRIWTQFSA